MALPPAEDTTGSLASLLVAHALDLDGVGQADAVQMGDISPRELVDESIARIEALNPKLNAVIHDHFERARALASSQDLLPGPFHGVPILLKDSAMAAGDPLCLGMRTLRDADCRAPFDIEFVARLRRAGFVLLGPGRDTPELLNQATTEPMAFGPTSNPWDTSRIAGGSSGGSAAAVAAGMVAVAHANDGGGFIRIPASACGLVGLKPTRGG